MLNRVVLIGRLTRDPELKRTPTSGAALTRFTLAVDRYFQFTRRETDFIRIITWGKLAERCKEYIAKGHLVAVDGHLMVRRWETPQGENRTIVEVRADDVRFLERASSSRGSGGSRYDEDGSIPDEDEYSDDDSGGGSDSWSGGGSSSGGASAAGAGASGAAGGGEPFPEDPDSSGSSGSLGADPDFPGGSSDSDSLPASGDLPADKSDSGKKDFGNISDSQLDEEIDLDDDDPFKEDF